MVQLLIHRRADVNHRGYGGAAAPLTCLAVPADGALEAMDSWEPVDLVLLMVKWGSSWDIMENHYIILYYIILYYIYILYIHIYYIYIIYIYILYIYRKIIRFECVWI